MSEILVEAVGNLGALGIVLWLVVRTFKVTLPRLAKDFEDGIRTARTDFRDALASQRDDFAKLVDEQREFFTKYTEAQQDFYDTRIEAEHERLKELSTFIKEQSYHGSSPHNH